MNTYEFLSYLESLNVELFTEGDNLRCIAPKGTLTSSLRTELVARKKELISQLRQVSLTPRPPFPSILPTFRDRNIPLSFAQQRLWFLDQMEPGFAYKESFALHLKGLLNIPALEQSLTAIVSRHEILRTNYQYVNSMPAQVISNSVDIKLPLIELSDFADGEKKTKTKDLINAEACKPFSLIQDPLFQATLWKLGQDEHILLLAMHHIVIDDWSIGILFRELEALYEAFSGERSSPLPELPIQYADFACWQRQWLQDEVLEKDLFYWKQQLSSEIPVLQLPTARPRPSVPSYQGAQRILLLPKALTQALKVLSKEEEVTLFMTLIAAFNAFLYRYTGQEDIIVGFLTAGRNQVKIEALIGYFVNTLPLRTDLSGNPSFRELLNRVCDNVSEALTHQDLPFEKLVEELRLPRDLSRPPLFQVLFILQNSPTTTLHLAGLSVTSSKIHNGSSKFDLSMFIIEHDEQLRLELDYNTDLFNTETIAQMLEHFQVLLEGIVANPEQRLSDLPLLTPAERHQLLVEWNDTEREYPQDKCIHQLFEEQVERTPDGIAVVFEGQKLTYRELNSKANQLANYLQKSGVKPEVLVGICVERSLDMVVGLLGILKAGGAYVPLDPAYPKERLNYMISDAQVKILLTQQELVSQLPEQCAAKICLDRDWSLIRGESQENPLCTVEVENLAYVIYTSGSTGKPKGVQIIHQGVVNFLSSMKAAPGLSETDTLLAVTSISFDIAALELYLPLSVGAKVFVVSRAIAADGFQLMNQLYYSEATTMQATPATWRMLIVSGWEGKPNLKILCGGEALQTELAHRLQRTSATLWNLYGPTETTIWSTVYEFNSSRETNQKPCLAIGRPIANTPIYLLDRHLNPVPIGVPGELYIGGPGLARGYLNNPELTTEKFIRDPFATDPTARLYKSGDLASWNPDGTISFHGRLDQQIKLRGFRIEPGEIESHLLAHPAIAQAAVVILSTDPANPRLIAYWVAQTNDGSSFTTPSAEQLRSFLAERSPSYMVPSAFVALDALPLTINGKLDRKALPAPSFPGNLQQRVEPSTELEQKLHLIWAEVLGHADFGINDNFFLIGGHSLAAARLVSRINHELKQSDSLISFFQYPTVAGQANIISGSVHDPYRCLVTLQPLGQKPPLFIIHGWGGKVWSWIHLARALAPQRPVFGLQAYGADHDLPPQGSLEEIVDAYADEILRQHPEGMINLLGYSGGGWYAYAVAGALLKRGGSISTLTLLGACCA